MRLLLVVAALLSAVPAFAAETMYPNDPDRQMKEALEEAFGVYIINPSRRRPEEKVEIKGDTAEFWLLYDPRKPDFDRIKCDAMRWTMFGRFGEDVGARRVFKQFSKVNNIELIVYHLKSTRTVDREGKYTVTKAPVWSLRTRLARRTADRVEWTNAAVLGREPKSDKELATCLSQAQKIVPFRTNREYFK